MAKKRVAGRGEHGADTRPDGGNREELAGVLHAEVLAGPAGADGLGDRDDGKAVVGDDDRYRDNRGDACREGPVQGVGRGQCEHDDDGRDGDPCAGCGIGCRHGR